MTKRDRPAAEPSQPDPTKDLWTLPEVTAYLGIAKNTAYDMAAAGQLPGALRVGSLWRVSVRRLMRELHGTPDAA